MIIQRKIEDLPYDYGDLSPYMSEKTLKFHHDKHYKKYADELVKLISDEPHLYELSTEDLLKELSKMEKSEKSLSIRNNAGGYYNHTIWWPMMARKSSSGKTGLMDKHIKSNFGSYDNIKKEMTEKSVKHFGSGWCWLCMKGSNMEVMCTPNQDNPIMDNSGFPILGIDLWEHAYYLDYQNRKKDYIESFWNIVNWKEVENRFLQAEQWNTNQIH